MIQTVSRWKQAASQLMTICLTSTDPKFGEIYLSNFATLNVLDLMIIVGVGRVKHRYDFSLPCRFGYNDKLWLRSDHADLQNALQRRNRRIGSRCIWRLPVLGGTWASSPSPRVARPPSASLRESLSAPVGDGSIIRSRSAGVTHLARCTVLTVDGPANSGIRCRW